MWKSGLFGTHIKHYPLISTWNGPGKSREKRVEWVLECHRKPLLSLLYAPCSVVLYCFRFGGTSRVVLTKKKAAFCRLNYAFIYEVNEKQTSVHLGFTRTQWLAVISFTRWWAQLIVDYARLVFIVWNLLFISNCHSIWSATRAITAIKYEQQNNGKWQRTPCKAWAVWCITICNRIVSASCLDGSVPHQKTVADHEYIVYWLRDIPLTVRNGVTKTRQYCSAVGFHHLLHGVRLGSAVFF